MSAVIERDPYAADPPPAPTDGPEGDGRGAHRTDRAGGRGEWLASWGVSLRMARREAKRHKGRGSLVVLMVGVPVGILTFLLTTVSTSAITGAEGIPIAMGNGQALVRSPQPVVLGQDPTDWSGQSGSTSEGTVKPIPGYPTVVDGGGVDAGTDRGAAAYVKTIGVATTAIGKLLGGTAIPMTGGSGTVTFGDRRAPVSILGLDGRADLGEKLRLVSGRWPASDFEALADVTTPGRGLPTSGTLSVVTSSSAGLSPKRTVTIVGTATTLMPAANADLVVLPTSPLTSGIDSWIIKRDKVIPWSEVRALNDHGLSVVSAEVLRNPPPASEIPRDVVMGMSNQTLRANQLLLGGGALLLLVTTLLVGPAFAVSAARSRRTLALAASNGALASQLRRTVLAQALVLGVAAALVGSALGVLVARILSAIYGVTWFGPGRPFDLPWLQVLAVTAVGVLAAVVAALIPTRRLGRIDIIGVMKGQNVSPPPNRFLFVSGTVLAVASAFALLAAVKASVQQAVLVVLPVVGLILGALLLVPTLLAVLGRLCRPLPHSLRMAARDAARQRARSAPAVAAVLGAVAALSTISIALASDTEQQRKRYVVQSNVGEGVVRADATSDVASIPARIHRIDPALLTTPMRTIDTREPWGRGVNPTKDFDTVWLNLVPPGCTASRTILDDVWMREQMNDSGAVEGGPAPEPPCQVAGTTASSGPSVLVMSAAQLIDRLGLTGGDAEVVRAGGAVVMSDHDLMTDGKVRIAHGTQRVLVTPPGAPAPTNDPSAGGNGVETTPPPVVLGQQDLPAVALPLTKDNAGRMLRSRLILTTESVAKMGVGTVETGFVVTSPTGEISPTTEERINAALGDFAMYVERGFQRDDALFVAILSAVFALLVLVVVLTSTALSLAEQQSDQATLAALGATKNTRRAMAAAQAFVTAIIGCALGVAVGLAPGVALAYPLTVTGYDELTGRMLTGTATVVIPWPLLAAVAFAIPAIAAGLAAAGIRRAPAVTRRAT